MTLIKPRSQIPCAGAIVFVAMITAVPPAAAQEANEVADAIRHIQAFPLQPGQSTELGSEPEERQTYLSTIAGARAVEAIPVLESYYARTTNPNIKAGVASALIRLGDKKDIYRKYVAANAMERIRSNDVGQGSVDAMSFVDLIPNSRAAEGIALLEEYYARTTDPEIKEGVASALVRLVDKNEAYWKFLLVLATPAVESDAPAYALAVGDMPFSLGPLARAEDPRGVPLLRDALASPNFFVASLAAEGLAQANDVASVPLIIDACKRLPPDMARFLADSLLFFNDPQAQKTFALYFPTTNVSEARAYRGGVFAGIPQHAK